MCVLEVVSTKLQFPFGQSVRSKLPRIIRIAPPTAHTSNLGCFSEEYGFVVLMSRAQKYVGDDALT